MQTESGNSFINCQTKNNLLLTFVMVEERDLAMVND